MPLVGFDSTDMLHILVEGLSSRYTKLDDIMTPEMASTVEEMTKQYDFLDIDLNSLPKEERGYKCMELLIERLSQDRTFGNLSMERLGNMGFKVHLDDCGPAHRIHARKMIGPVCPKILFMVLMIKAKLPDLWIRMDYSAYTPTGSTTEIIIEGVVGPGSKEGQDACPVDDRKGLLCLSPEDKADLRSNMHAFFEGLNKRFKDPKDYLTDEMLDRMMEIGRTVLPGVDFERNWNDHFHLIDVLIDANNDDPICFTAETERLGSMGLVLRTKPVDEEALALASCCTLGDPLALMIAAIVKFQFRDLKIKIRTIKRSDELTETEIMMQ